MERSRIEFGTDGIRGIAGEYPLDPTTVLRIGQAIGVWLRKTAGDQPRIIVGRDTRISGNMLLHTLAGGLLSEGVNIFDTGIMTTPGLAFLTRQGSYDLGIIISASHNPFDQNGLKLIGPEGFKLADDAEADIETLIADLPGGDMRKHLGSFYEYHGKPLYLNHLAEGFNFDTLEDLAIVLDCANGAATPIAPDAFRRVGVLDLTTINAEPNGTNINVMAGSEYVRRDRATILNLIKQRRADVGIAFDGDADRVVCVTPEGMLIDGDHLLGILALELKAQGKLTGDTVVATDMSNSGLEHFLAEHGITLSRTKVGDRYVMDRLREKGYILGGEQAGHVILLDSDHTAGDGIYIALSVCAIIARNKRSGGPTLHQLASRIPRYPQVIASASMRQRADLDTVSGLDELRRETLKAFSNQGRVNIRFSGTEPNLLRAMVEGGPQTSMNEVVERALALCKLVARHTSTDQPTIDIVDCATGAPVTLQHK
jgi:phosphoglucosamine mutase